MVVDVAQTCHKGLQKGKESLYMHLDPRVEFFPRWMETA